MKSRVAREAERALVEATQRLTPEERLNAYLAHCRLVMELYEAGRKAWMQTSCCRSQCDTEDPIPGLLRLRDGYDNRVDLLIGLRGMEPQAFSRAIEVSFQGKTLKFVGREDFIAMKVFAGGPMDMIDASRALAASGGCMDRELLRRLARRYGREAAEALERLLGS